MSLFLKSQVQAFFDVNGMDVMSADSIPVAETINGYEWVTEEAAVAYVYKSFFSGLYPDLVTFCKN
jgi:hypothetical protein